ncbi:hypothetical protein PM082_002094 [Marasmius tenuissimus]|nr:hypothetical protein PM082_002094 [Marasmius tenuissimus]
MPQLNYKLPPELLTKIFSFSLDTPQGATALFDTSSDTLPLNSSIDPWAVSQVCQYWRELVLNTPSLWSFVSFDETVTGLHRLELQLQRAASQPLTIVIRTTNPRSTLIQPFILSLCPLSSTWRHLYIDLEPDVFFPSMSSIRGRLQLLESLHINLKVIGGIHHNFDCFEIAPKLQTLIFSHGLRHSPDEVGRIRLPYEQIIHYHWKGGPNSHKSTFLTNVLFGTAISNVVKRARFDLHPNTMHFYCGLQAMNVSTDILDRVAATFNHLAELEMGVTEGSPLGISLVLPFIRLPFPTLEKLTIPSSGLDQTILSAFLTLPHHQPLTYLSICRVEMPPNELHTLSYLPLLETLCFGVFSGISDTYLALFHPHQPRAVVPHLRQLSLLPTEGFSSSYSEENLLDILERRWRISESDMGTALGSSYLQLLSVKLDKERIENQFARERLDQLLAEGLIVEPMRKN